MRRMTVLSTDEGRRAAPSSPPVVKSGDNVHGNAARLLLVTTNFQTESVLSLKARNSVQLDRHVNKKRLKIDSSFILYGCVCVYRYPSNTSITGRKKRGWGAEENLLIWK